MSIIFYDHLVNKHEIFLYIDNLPEPENHKSKLKHLVDDIIHQGLIEFVLQKLHSHHHRTFLNHLHQTPYDPEIISFLKDHIHPDIETELQEQIDLLLQTIEKDLKK